MQRVYHPCIDCFRAVLRNSNIEAPTTEDIGSWTPLHWSTFPSVGLATTWELLCYNRECVNIRNDENETALAILEQQNLTQQQPFSCRQNAKIFLLKLAQNYNHVPKVPSNDEMITTVESHPVCTMLAPRLEPGKDTFIVHKALAAKCPQVLVQALVEIFPNQVQQEYTRANGRLPLHIALQSNLGASVRLLAITYPAAMFVADPATGYFPIQQAVLNVGKDGSLGNIDAVNVLLRADPAFLDRTSISYYVRHYKETTQDTEILSKHAFGWARALVLSHQHTRQQCLSFLSTSNLASLALGTC